MAGLLWSVALGLTGCEATLTDDGSDAGDRPPPPVMEDADVPPPPPPPPMADAGEEPPDPGDAGTVVADAGAPPEPDAGVDAAVDAGPGGPPAPCLPSSGPLPVIPCGAGFGMETPAGSGRSESPPRTTIHRVTTLASSGPGSLDACVSASGPRVCIFEVSGVIERTRDLEIWDPYITIAGQTAPSPGISIHGAGLRIAASDVLVSHLRIRVGDRPDGPPVHSRDAIRISNRDREPRRIVIDHCSLAFSSDEMTSVWYRAGDVTFIDTLMGLPLNDSIHVDEGASGPAPHGFGPLFGQESDRVALVRSVLAHHKSRNPMSRANGLVMANNVVYNWHDVVTSLASSGGSVNRSTIVGNVYIPGTNSVMRPPILLTGMPSSSRIYLDDNDGPGATRDPWSLAENRVGSHVVASSPPVVYDHFAPLPAAGLRAHLLPTVGAWPSARDAVDRRIVREVETETGSIINCVEDDGSRRCALNAGGWPTVAENTRALTPPARPDADDDGDGYTNLEAWLFSFAP